MIFWLLFLCVDKDCTLDYPYHFAFKSNCAKMGRELVQNYKYENYRCVKEVRE